MGRTLRPYETSPPKIYRLSSPEYLSRPPADAPPLESVRGSLDVMRQQEMAVYQRLYYVGLTSPYADAPFKVERCINSGVITTHIRITPKGNERMAFTVARPEDIERVVETCELLMNAVNAMEEPLGLYQCCPLAKREFCVCIAMWSCPIHGTHCHGSHD